MCDERGTAILPTATTPTLLKSKLLAATRRLTQQKRAVSEGVKGSNQGFTRGGNAGGHVLDGKAQRQGAVLAARSCSHCELLQGSAVKSRLRSGTGASATCAHGCGVLCSFAVLGPQDHVVLTASSAPVLT